MSTASKARKSYRGVAQFGRALRSGRRGRRFKSCHLDQKTLEGEKLPKVLFFSKIWLKYRVLWHFEF